MAMNGNARTMWLVSVICVTSLCVNIYSYLTYQNYNIIGFYSRQQIEISRASEYTSTLQTSHVAGHVNSTLPLFLGKGEAMQNPTSIRPIIDILTTMREKDTGNNITLCSLVPPHLLGPLVGMKQEMSPETLLLIFPDMKNGRLRPTECVARERLAIIIPYRNRYPHLHIFLHNIIPFLIRQQADATIFVIEQAPPETFNRGALLNVGFMEARKLGRFDCFIFHDVDLIPLDDRHMYRCGDNPKHFAVAMNKYNFRMPYFDYFGGVVGFTGRQYLDINGCSNDYFGWGGEDDDLKERASNRGYTILRSPVSIARYDMIRHDRDKGNEPNPFRTNRLIIARKRQYVEGLNTIKYKLNNITFHHLYTWINVSLNKTEILQNSRHML